MAYLDGLMTQFRSTGVVMKSVSYHTSYPHSIGNLGMELRNSIRSKVDVLCVGQ